MWVGFLVRGSCTIAAQRPGIVLWPYYYDGSPALVS